MADSQGVQPSEDSAAARLERIEDLLVQIRDRLPDREVNTTSTNTVDVDGT